MDSPRFVVEGNSVIFPRTGSRYHVSFSEKYKGMTIPQARRKMKSLFATRSAQDEMIHYLKTQNLLKR